MHTPGLNWNFSPCNTDEIFGELSFLLGKGATATIVAEGDVEIYIIEAEYLKVVTWELVDVLKQYHTQTTGGKVTSDSREELRWGLEGGRGESQKDWREQKDWRGLKH